MKSHYLLAGFLFTLPFTSHSQTRASGAQIQIATRVSTSTSDSVTVSDCGRLVSYSNAGPIAVTLPDAPTLPAGCWMDVENTGAGTMTLSINGQSTIDGLSTVSLTANQGVHLVTTGATYLSERGQGQGQGQGSGGGITYNAGPSGAITVDNVAHTVDFSTGAICLATLACAPTGAFDLSGATMTKPARNAVADPATCGISEKYFNTTTGTFRNCLTPNTWTNESGSGGGGTTQTTSLPASVHILGTTSGSVGVAATAADLAAISSATGGGSAQAQTVNLSPAVTTLTDNLSVCWVPAGANTGAGPTLQINSTPPYPIVKNGNTALAAADINPPAKACVLFDLANSRFQLQNPQTVASGGTGGGSSVNAGDNLSNASGTFNWVPFDPTTAWGRDEFCGGQNVSYATSLYGELGWTLHYDSDSGFGTYQPGVAAHPCILRLTTGSVGAWDNIQIGLYSADKVQQFPPANTGTYEYNFIFRLNQLATEYLLVGLSGANPEPAFDDVNDVYLRYDTSASPNWQLRSCAASSCTSTNTGIAADTNWHRVRIFATSGATSICMDACLSPTSVPTAPSVSMWPAIMLENSNSAVSRTVDIDYFSYAFRGLSRW
jgi:hypothetical protein